MARRRLGADTVRATCWEMSEPEALMLGPVCCARRTRRRALEQGWLLRELVGAFALAEAELARRFDQSLSWVCRRLALVAGLPPEIQEQVRAGALRPTRR